MILLLISVFALKVIFVEGGQCWYCKQVLTEEACKGALFSDGVCKWQNNNCVPVMKDYSYISQMYPNLDLFADTQCSDRPLIGCYGQEFSNSKSYCFPEPSGQACTSLTPSDQCELITNPQQCLISRGYGCVFFNGSCTTDTCQIKSKGMCLPRYHRNYQLSMCGLKDGKCDDIEIKDINPKMCLYLSRTIGTFVQYDGENCVECVGDFPEEWTKIIPISRY